MSRILTPDLKKNYTFKEGNKSEKHLRNQATFTKSFMHSGMSSSKRFGILVVENNSINKSAIKATH